MPPTFVYVQASQPCCKQVQSFRTSRAKDKYVSGVVSESALLFVPMPFAGYMSLLKIIAFANVVRCWIYGMAWKSLGAQNFLCSIRYKSLFITLVHTKTGYSV